MPEPNPTLLHQRIQRLRSPHQQPTKEKQRQDRNTHDSSKSIPVLFGRVHALQVCDLDGEVGGHEADWEEDYGEFCEEGGGAREAGCGFGVFLGVYVEVLEWY